jgi:hypothetical protein
MAFCIAYSRRGKGAWGCKSMLGEEVQKSPWSFFNCGDLPWQACALFPHFYFATRRLLFRYLTPPSQEHLNSE